MSRSAMTSAYREIDQFVAAGAGLHQIGDYIASLRLSDEERSALELYAWAETSEPRRRTRPRPTVLTG